MQVPPLGEACGESKARELSHPPAYRKTKSDTSYHISSLACLRLTGEWGRERKETERCGRRGWTKRGLVAARESLLPRRLVVVVVKAERGQPALQTAHVLPSKHETKQERTTQ